MESTSTASIRRFAVARKQTALLAATMAVIVIMTIAPGCGSETEPISPGPAAPEQPVLTEAYVQEVAENKTANPMVVREATISGEGNDQTVNIGIERPAALQDGSVTGVMAAYGQRVFNSLFQIPDVSSVTITMYGVQQGVPGDDVAMRIRLDRDQLQEVDWSMFGPMTISDMVSEYYVDPAIESSSFH